MGSSSGAAGGYIPPRDVVYDHACSTSISRIFTTAESADQQMNAFEWILAREADFSKYPLVRTLPDGREIRVVKSTAFPAYRAVVLVFSVSLKNDKVYFHDVYSAGALPQGLPPPPPIPPPATP